MSWSSDPSVDLGYASGDVVPKTARTTSGDSGWIQLCRLATVCIVQLDSNGGTGTLPTLDVELRTSFDGTDATEVDVPNGGFTQVTSGASDQIISVSTFHRYIKVVWTIGGTGPSFNFGVYLTTRR